MSTVTPDQLASYIGGKSNVLVLAGYLCDEMEFEGKKLSDYVAELAAKLNAPVAATGNSVTALRQKGVKAQKKFAVPLVEMLRYDQWRDPIMANRPEVLLLIGYPPSIARGLVSAAQGVASVVLSTAAIEEATYSFPDASLQGYRLNLEKLLDCLRA